MKTNILVILSIWFLCIVSINSSMAQASNCDPCTAPWGPPTQSTYSSQTVQGLSPSCTFTIMLEYESRICNGIPQVRLIGYTIGSETMNPNCKLHCFHVGLLMRKATKLLLQDLGGHIVVNKLASCFYLIEFDPAGQFATCLGNEINNFSNWYAVRPCGKSCCVAEYELQANGDVATISSYSDPCMGVPPNPLPTDIIVVCGGMKIKVPVIPPSQPLTCEPACDNSGDIFSAKTVSTDDKKFELVNLVYPNPAGNSINITNWQRWTEVRIYDVSGKLMLKSELKSMTLDISDFPRGFYNMILSNEKEANSSRQKFVKE